MLYVARLKAVTKWIEVVKVEANKIGIATYLPHNRREFSDRVDNFENIRGEAAKDYKVSEAQKMIRRERIKHSGKIRKSLSAKRSKFG